MEIESNPALVNTRDSLRASDAYLRMHAFNHVIVHVPLNGKSHWIDPTLTYQQGKLGNLYEPDYGFALIVNSDTQSLTSMASTQSATKRQIHNLLTVDADDNSFAAFKVETTRTGGAADQLRSYVTENGIEQVTEEYEEYYQGIFPELEFTSTVAVMNLPRNSVLTTEIYEIYNLWDSENSDKKRHLLKAEGIRNWMIAPGNPRKRKNAYKLANLADVGEFWAIEFNNDVSDYRTSDTIETPEFKFTVEIIQSEEERRLTIYYQLEIIAHEVIPERIVDYTDAINQAWDWTSLYITPNGIKRNEKATIKGSEIALNE
jgi:hypothetical protein